LVGWINRKRCKNSTIDFQAKMHVLITLKSFAGPMDFDARYAENASSPVSYNELVQGKNRFNESAKPASEVDTPFSYFACLFDEGS